MRKDRRIREQDGSAALLRLLRDAGPMTRAEIIESTGWARSTVAQRVDDLLGANLALTVRDVRSTGGRPPERVVFNGSAGVVLAACFGASSCDLAVLDLAGRVLVEARDEHDVRGGPEASLAWLASRFDVLLERAQRSPERIRGVGVGLPGPVDFAGGQPIASPALPGWDGFGVGAWLSERYGQPALVENDANLMALGTRASWPTDVQHLLFVKADAGFGAGLLVAGELHRGAHGLAGDLGHMFVPGHDDVLCDCGNAGCLDAVAGGRALAAELAGQGLVVEGAGDVAELARSGDLRAIRALREAGRDLGYGLAGLLNAVNPELVVVGGALVDDGNHLLSGIREVVYRRSAPMATSTLRIVAAGPTRPGATVAAALGVSTLLQAPGPAALAQAAA